jgi:hypothetical protein
MIEFFPKARGEKETYVEHSEKNIKQDYKHIII